MSIDHLSYISANTRARLSSLCTLLYCTVLYLIIYLGVCPLFWFAKRLWGNHLLAASTTLDEVL